MSPGKSKITRKAKVDEDLRRILLTCPFEPRGGGKYFRWEKPEDAYDLTIIELLRRLDYPYKDKNTIEYWFQNKKEGESLFPHCDYNHHIRALGGDPSFVIDREKMTSPITLSVYLEVRDMIGGHLCISDKDWFDMENPFVGPEEITRHIGDAPYEAIMPEEGDILFFEGSRYFHWIDKIQQGTRKSVLINFWDIDYHL